MTVVFDRPYEFVPPHRGNGWPSFIQMFKIVDKYLKRKEGIVSHECRHLDRLNDSLARGDGILLAPNHCRYADPLVLGWPAREAKTHVYAMASWHLFNTGGWDGFAIRKMGGFSIYREGADRQSLETAIDILADAERPLILFPEGTTNRTNDLLKPLLEGVTFIARTAARRREKKSGGHVVVHPVGIKYLCAGDIRPWADEQLDRLEMRLSWGPTKHRSMTLVERLWRLSEGLLALKEIEWTGTSKQGPLPERRDALIEALLQQSEERNAIAPEPNATVRDRVRVIRSTAAISFFANPANLEHRHQCEADVRAADLAQDLSSHPDCYLTPGEITDTRVVETIQRIQEAIEGKANAKVPLHAVVEIDEAIAVPTDKAPRGAEDPLLSQIRDRLTAMLGGLSNEARRIDV